jgi:hypothetical protein
MCAVHQTNPSNDDTEAAARSDENARALFSSIGVGVVVASPGGALTALRVARMHPLVMRA